MPKHHPWLPNWYEIVDSDPKEQLEWANDITGRVSVSPEISTSVLILDSGVNYDNPLLQPYCNSDLAETWKPEWN